MKALNNLKFIANASQDIEQYKIKIEKVDSYDRAKAIGNAALGYINCMITYLNTMIDKENNDFTGDLDEVIIEWRSSIYQKVIDKADEMNQGSDEIFRLCEARDNY